MAGSYKRKDHLYIKAKAEGYRSRAAFKLLELNKKCKLLKNGMWVLDLGCWPGGWMQVAAGKVMPGGGVVGIDLTEMENLNLAGATTITGDARSEGNIAAAMQQAGGRFDLVLSDMSPKLSGVKSADRAAAQACAELALFVSQRALKPGGNMVIKVFKSQESEQFVKLARPMFNKLMRKELASTRKTSNEFYVVGLGLQQEALTGERAV